MSAFEYTPSSGMPDEEDGLDYNDSYDLYQRPYVSSAVGEALQTEKPVLNRTAHLLEYTKHHTRSIAAMVDYPDSSPLSRYANTFWRGRYGGYREMYSFQPFREFSTKVFSDNSLKEEFVFKVFDYLGLVGANLNGKTLLKNKKRYWSKLPHARFLTTALIDSQTQQPMEHQDTMEKMLVYIFIRYLQDHPDYFRDMRELRKSQP